jgi:hypothetical protein
MSPPGPSSRKDISKHHSIESVNDKSEINDDSEQFSELDAPRVAQWVDEDDIDAEVDEENSTVDSDVSDHFVSRIILFI